NAGFGSVGLFHIAMYRFKGTTAQAAGSGFGEAGGGCDVGCCAAAEREGEVLGSGPLHESSRIPATTTMDARRTTTPIMQMMMVKRRRARTTPSWARNPRSPTDRLPPRRAGGRGGRASSHADRSRDHR